VKPDADTLLTVPTAPPAAGPDRAFEPPPLLETVVVVEAATVLAVPDPPCNAMNPVIATITASTAPATMTIGFLLSATAI
jgi:hypothetical protein